MIISYWNYLCVCNRAKSIPLDPTQMVLRSHSNVHTLPSNDESSFNMIILISERKIQDSFSRVVHSPVRWNEMHLDKRSPSKLEVPSLPINRSFWIPTRFLTLAMVKAYSTLGIISIYSCRFVLSCLIFLEIRINATDYVIKDCSWFDLLFQKRFSWESSGGNPLLLDFFRVALGKRLRIKVSSRKAVEGWKLSEIANLIRLQKNC